MGFSSVNQCYVIIMCLLIELFSQVSDVANGPLVYYALLCFAPVGWFLTAGLCTNGRCPVNISLPLCWKVAELGTVNPCRE